MSTSPRQRDASPTDASAPRPILRAESEALYSAFIGGIVGAIYGFIVSAAWPDLPLAGRGWSFGAAAAIGAGVMAALASGAGYWRSRRYQGQEWRATLSSWKFTVNTVSVVVVHTVLSVLATIAIYLTLSQGLVGLLVVTFWAVVLMAITLGLVSYVVYLSVSRVTTQRMTSLLMAFIVIGTLTAMVTSPDPYWWKVHFSQLGTFETLSSVIFNGTLIAAGLLVTTFAVYTANDMRRLVAKGALVNPRSAGFVSILFVVMGIMLACVGIFPVDVSLWLHNLSASGMGIMFLVLLIGGHWMLRGMPRAYFISAWAFLAALLASIALFSVGFFSLAAFEIIVFALIFGWIAVFVRFLGVTGQRE